MKQIFSFVHNLSLHIVAGACISALFIADVLNVELSRSHLVILGLSVWIIYTIDHLIDGSKTENPTAPRHQFHKQHQNVILMALPWFFIFLFFNLFKVPTNTLISGFFVVCLVFLYFLTYKQLSLRIPSYKELLIALGFSLGVFVTAIDFSAELLNLGLFLLFIQFFMLSYLNVLIISVLDYHIDKQDGFISIATNKDQEYIERLIYRSFAILGVSILLGFFLWSSYLNYVYFQLVIVLMAGTLFYIFRKRQILSNIQSHFLVDAVFLWPVVYFILRFIFS
jgi:hypothetical protein